MKIHYLDRTHYLFGNKGAVWSNKIHIIDSKAEGYGTMCGTPTLSSNWAAINELTEEHGLCPECKAKYDEQLQAISKTS